MPSEKPTLDSDLIEIIPIHFDVPDHSLPLPEFIESANATKAIIDNFNKELFDGKLKYKLLVLSPKPASFIEILGITVTVGGVAWAFLESSIGRALIMGLTGFEPTYWSEKAGEAIRSLNANESDNETNEHEKIEEKIENKSVATVVNQITQNFFMMEPERLNKIGISKGKYRDAYEARNKFYQSCLGNRDIQAIGFSEKPEFPVTRANFSEYIVDIPPSTEEEKKIIWLVEVISIKVFSPNWHREGRKWLAVDEDERDVYFSIEDDRFWDHAKIRDINPQITDRMKVQWAYPSDKPNRSNVIVLRVLSYNDETLSDPLTDEELENALKNIASFETL